MKSSKKEIQRLQNQLSDYQKAQEAQDLSEITQEHILKYIQETEALLSKVQKAYDRKQARKYKYSVSEGDAMPANMDLDGELIEVPAPPQGYTDQFGTSVTLEEAQKLNARGRKARRSQSQQFSLMSFTIWNLSGGTTVVNGRFAHLTFSGPIRVQSIKSWSDYEIGQRHIGLPLNPELRDFLATHSSDGQVYFGQFDLVEASHG